MAATIGAVFCLAYILGLLLTGIPGKILEIPIGAIVILGAGAIAFFVPRFWRMGPKPLTWLLAGLVGFLAVLYFQIRLPQPNNSDICHLIIDTNTPGAELCQPIAAAKSSAGSAFTVQGKITSAPRLTRSDRIQFELEATQVNVFSREGKESTSTQKITGTVYVTVPKLEGKDLYPGQTVVVEGSLYKPKPASNPGGFDFQKYLAQKGIFAGLNGQGNQPVRLTEGEQPQPPLWWSIQQQIIHSQEKWLGVVEGHLISAMVIGKGTVDVPYDLQDQFKRAGLAHALAASGAQVSMLIGLVLTLTQRLPNRIRFGLGIGVLLLYVGLTGLEAAVLRAAVMGFVVLFAMSAERKVKPLGSLLFAATLLLLFNPLWIWNLGFQLSFLATLGLLVTVPILTKWLDWMPSAIAPMIAVPIAAYLWTLPLQLVAFGVVSPYSILINILVSPLITIISIGGMISALGALVYPLAGSFLAWLLHYPTALFIKITEIGNQLPGSQYAVGTIKIEQVLFLYGLILLIWWWRRSHSYWWVAGIVGISLVAVPVWYTSTHLLQVTVLATSSEPVLIVQDRGKVGLVNSGNAKDATFSVLPFLQKQGINQIDWAIATDLRNFNLEGWQQIVETVPIQVFYNSPAAQYPTEAKPGKPNQFADDAIAFNQNYQALLNRMKAHQGEPLLLSRGQVLQLGSTTAQFIAANTPILQIQIGDRTWLLLSHIRSLAEQRRVVRANLSLNAQVLGWSGTELSPQLLEKVKPEVAIAAAKSIAPATEDWFNQQGVTFYLTSRQGAVQWTPQQGFHKALGSSEDEISLL
jgi:competence protein ComEC